MRTLHYYEYMGAAFDAAVLEGAAGRAEQAFAAGDGAACNNAGADGGVLQAYSAHFKRLHSAAAAAFVKLRDA